MRWGIGLKLILFTFLYAVFGYLGSIYIFNEKVSIDINSKNTYVSIFLFIFGILLYLKLLKKLRRAFKRGVLLKEGGFRVVRHPIYSLWGFIIIPSITLFVDLKFFYSIIIFYFFILIIFIKEEERETEREFGEEFKLYRNNVPMLFPTIDSISGILFWPEFTKKYDEKLYIVREKYANFFIYGKEENYIAIDSGIGGKRGLIEIEKLKIPKEKVIAIFFTHSDFDHINGRKYFPNAKIYFCKGEDIIIDGLKPRFFNLIYAKKNLYDYIKIESEREITIENIRILPLRTPGHTPGHCSYIVDGEYLFTGDLIRIKEGKIYPFYSFLSYDFKEHLKSYSKILNLIKKHKIFTAHHGIFEITG